MNKFFKVFLTVCFLASAVALFIFSPYFRVRDITVAGNEFIYADEIIGRSGITTSSNLLLLNTREARKGIMGNFYVDGAEFVKNYPGGIEIQIRVRRLSGYVEYMQGTFLFIDENGRVIEINSVLSGNYPVVRGLKFERFRLGEILEVEDSAAFKTVVRYARLLNKYQLSDRISNIDVSDNANTRIMFHQIEFNVGDDADADEKIRTMVEVMENLPNASMIKGQMDLREIRGQYVLKFYG